MFDASQVKPIESRPPARAAASHRRVAVLGGVYSNYLALEEAIKDARRRNVEAIYCLGDLGAFGPHPDRVFPILIDNDVHVVRGNYDDSIGRGLPDCQCGYTDPRDNHFAAVSYRYTYQQTSERWRPWLAGLPTELRIQIGDSRVLLCHGSPRKTNEFLWESTTSTQFLERLCRDHDAEVILATHTGIKWRRDLGDGRLFVNVGVLGRPENDGRANVSYAILEAQSRRTTDKRRHETAEPAEPQSATSFAANVDDVPRPIERAPVRVANDGTERHTASQPTLGVHVEFIPVSYDHERLAAEMRSEGLPNEFADTILSGYWTTCLEILPGKERRRGRY